MEELQDDLETQMELNENTIFNLDKENAELKEKFENFKELSKRVTEELFKENAELKDLLKWCWKTRFKNGWCGKIKDGHMMGTKEDCSDCQKYTQLIAVMEGK